MLENIYYPTYQLLLFSKVLADEVGRSYLDLLRLLAEGDANPAEVGRTYGALFRKLAAASPDV